MEALVVNIIAGFQNNFSEGLYSKFKSYRYKVFVEHLGWELNCPHNEELDQFDKVDTAYVVAQDRDSNIIGCARLLPTTQPYLLGEIFPQLLNGIPLPCSPEIWELSRFSAVDFSNPPTTVSQAVSSPVSIAILQEAINFAREQGAKQLITTSPLGVERLLRAAGFRAHRAGPPMTIDGYSMFACLIDV
ncbi:acyl-homoserine-lactone synthase AbaI [Acinetobacter nosocomialis]|uniref:Acyl-homoserine-lactone synthase n=1 Tax=Acinetobacter nosocomialis TaxID=106654 RepID=A0A2L1VLE3_ACINO|nr:MULTISPECIES: acyl-homoserine-lactone synthase AbaI [Acinetobacter]ARG18666.1 N-acylhomoserine lactone synthase [Acinetobacter nosocomialis]AVF45896.1 GNAT family N-acetyltransferase [Acinetobacter nosocomialis]AWL20896.1 GNAT family N-acetyltransferase [Acinetobacter nosocomialis]MBD0442782.1 GNAT family N-acetyltransferase [Acinetobacter nosocomialis]MBD8352582.1 acyl-homoserine-lactone synthase AbaI [Acinetobacter nosocomialis]